MYLRPITIRKSGKEHRYWTLVRSVRRNGKVSQETVAYLGELTAEERARAKDLARVVMGRSPDSAELFEERVVEEETIRVRLRGVGIERLREFGNVFLGYKLWELLGLDALCRDLLPEGREDVPWGTMAQVLVLARLCEPSSELHIAQSWFRKTALSDILRLPDELVNDDRLYRALDRLLPHKERIEQHLVKRWGDLFSIPFDLFLYDVTSTYFEGEAERNNLAARGYSRDHRPDCKQVCIALVVTKRGFPLGYEVFPGNRVDVTTVEEIVETMEAKHGMADRIWVMDRGMMSEDNFQWLQKTGRKYVIGTSKGELKKWRVHLTDPRDWRTIREGIEVKVCRGPKGDEAFVLCRSADRREKEKAMHERFSKRIETILQKMANRLTRARQPVDRDTLNRQIGRLFERNSRAAGKYIVRIERDRSVRSGLVLAWEIRADWQEWAALSEGAYVIRTNLTDWKAEDLWPIYIRLTDVEDAFRIQKDPLGLRPVWHQREDRVQAHILVCFLAYALWKTLEAWQERAGLGNSPKTILDEFQRIQTVDVVLPVVNDLRREVRIRCVSRPEKTQAALLDRLGLRLPERLRIPTAVSPDVVKTSGGHLA
jgi:transposase